MKNIVKLEKKQVYRVFLQDNRDYFVPSNESANLELTGMRYFLDFFFLPYYWNARRTEPRCREWRVGRWLRHERRRRLWSRSVLLSILFSQHVFIPFSVVKSSRSLKRTNPMTIWRPSRLDFLLRALSWYVFPYIGRADPPSLSKHSTNWLAM